MAVARHKITSGFKRILKPFKNKQTGFVKNASFINAVAIGNNYDADFESNNMTDYFDSYESYYTISPTIKYSGNYAMKVDMPSVGGGAGLLALKTFDESFEVSETQLYVYYDSSGGSRNDDFTFSLRDELNNKLTTIDFRREYIVNSYCWLNGTSSINCGTLPNDKWMRCTWSNIDYTAKTFDFEIYNETDSSSFFTVADVPFSSSDFDKLKKIEFSAASYSGIAYRYYMDNITINGELVKWQRII